jgi:hypothetical protein
MNDKSPEIDRRRSPWQFSLRMVFLVFVVVASALGALGGTGILAAVLVVAVAGFLRIRAEQSRVPRSGPSRVLAIAGLVPFVSRWLHLRVLLLVIGFAFVALVVTLLLSALLTARESSWQGRCFNNLRQLALSLYQHHEVHGSLPPAYIADKNGKPMHSWRVLILPYLEQEALHDAYDFNEPWDGSNNAKLAEQRAPLYLFRCPSEFPDRTRSNYVAVVGPNTMWPGPEGVSLDDIPDGAANTILVIEWPGADIHWMEPRDVSFDETCAAAGGKNAGGLRSRHVVEGGWFHRSVPVIHVVMADGRARRLPADIRPEQLAALLTRDGGEPIDWDALEIRPPLNWGRVLALAIFVLSSLWLIARPPSNGESRLRRDKQEPQMNTDAHG